MNETERKLINAITKAHFVCFADIRARSFEDVDKLATITSEITGCSIPAVLCVSFFTHWRSSIVSIVDSNKGASLTVTMSCNYTTPPSFTTSPLGTQSFTLLADYNINSNDNTYSRCDGGHTLMSEFERLRPETAYNLMRMYDSGIMKLIPMKPDRGFIDNLLEVAESRTRDSVSDHAYRTSFNK